jgi:hypothetical protein
MPSLVIGREEAVLVSNAGGGINSANASRGRHPGGNQLSTRY